MSSSSQEKFGLVVPLVLWLADFTFCAMFELMAHFQGISTAAKSYYAHNMRESWHNNYNRRLRRPHRPMDGRRNARWRPAAAHNACARHRNFLRLAGIASVIDNVRLRTPISKRRFPAFRRYVSCSQDGQICLWDAIGGRAIDNTMQQHVHRKIIPYVRFLAHNLARGMFAEQQLARSTHLDAVILYWRLCRCYRYGRPRSQHSLLFPLTTRTRLDKRADRRQTIRQT